MLPFESANYDEQVTRLTRAAQDALRSYALGGAHVRLILHVNNAVFEVRHGDQRYALRLHRHGLKRREWIASELLWLEALARETSLCVPRPVRTVDGDLLTETPVEGIAGPLQVSLLDWVEGTVHKTADLTLDQIQQIGIFLGRLHAHSAHFIPPEGFALPRLDWEGLFGQDSPYNPGDAARIFTPAQTIVFDAVAERVRQTTAALDQMPGQFGLIHADLIVKNYLFRRDSLCALDFDNSAFGYYLYDLAPPLLQFSAEPAYAQRRDALWSGYTRFRPQQDELRHHLEVFVAARHVASCRWIAGNLHNPRVRAQAPEIIQDRVAELEQFLVTGRLERRSRLL